MASGLLSDVLSLILQLSRWEGNIIDAHTTHLIMAKDAHQLLIEFSEQEDRIVSWCKFMCKLWEDYFYIVSVHIDIDRYWLIDYCFLTPSQP